MINKLVRKKSKPDDNSKLIVFYQDKLVFKQESNEFFLNYQDLKSYISVNDTFLIGYKDNPLSGWPGRDIPCHPPGTRHVFPWQ